MGYFVESAATDEDRADGIDEIVHRVDVGGQIGPVGHGARGGEEAAEQHQTDHEEPHDEHGLLHGVAVVGDDESERREEQCQQDSEQIDQHERPLTGDAVDSPRQDKAYGEHQQSDEPIGDELGQDERPFADGGYVDLLDSTFSFSPTIFSAGRKPQSIIIRMPIRAGIMKTL